MSAHLLIREPANTPKPAYYSLLVTAVGPITRVEFNGNIELTFRGRVDKKNGTVRHHHCVVRNTVAQPRLVEQALDALKAGEARMTLYFERIITPAGDNVSKITTIAVVDRVAKRMPIAQYQLL